MLKITLLNSFVIKVISKPMNTVIGAKSHTSNVLNNLYRLRISVLNLVSK